MVKWFFVLSCVVVKVIVNDDVYNICDIKVSEKCV